MLSAHPNVFNVLSVNFSIIRIYKVILHSTHRISLYIYIGLHYLVKLYKLIWDAIRLPVRATWPAIDISKGGNSNSYFLRIINLTIPISRPLLLLENDHFLYLKDNIRNAIDQDRLSSLALLCIEFNETKKPHVDQ